MTSGVKDVYCHHACVRTWGHGGYCRCQCGLNLGLKDDRERELRGYLSCGPQVKKGAS